MKVLRYLLQSVWCSICITVQAQTSALDYRPFAQDGKIWVAQVGLIMENIYGNRIDGDTLINGEIWKKVYNYWGSEEKSEYYAAIRDVEKKVYIIAKGSNKARLLYDFDLKEGNTVKCGIEGNAFGCLLNSGERLDTLLGFPLEAYLKVERIDTIMARGLLHRRFTLSLQDAFKRYFLQGWETVVGSVIWIEGVGSGAGPFSPWLPIPPDGSYLLGCDVNKTCIFGYPDFYEADNPADISSSKSQDVQPSEISGLYDSSGRRLSTPPAKGVYIENGRKRLTIDH